MSRHPAGESDVGRTAPRHDRRPLPLRVGTRASPLALMQTRLFMARLTGFCPVLRQAEAFEEHAIATTGDRIQDKRLAELGGKGLFAKEIHEALLDGRIDFAVHSLKDLETELPPGIVLACCMAREDARDALILAPQCGPADPADPLAAIPPGGVVGTSSVRRAAQLLHRRPDLAITLLRGNVQTRLAKVRSGAVDATMLALAGLRRLGLAHEAAAILDPEMMVPAAGQGIVGITVRVEDSELHDLLAGIEDPDAAAVSQAERAMLAALDGSCRTPIGGHAELVATEDGTFLLKRAVVGRPEDAVRLGRELGRELRRDSPASIFAG